MINTATNCHCWIEGGIFRTARHPVCSSTAHGKQIVVDSDNLTKAFCWYCPDLSVDDVKEVENHEKVERPLNIFDNTLKIVDILVMNILVTLHENEVHCFCCKSSSFFLHQSADLHCIKNVFGVLKIEQTCIAAVIVAAFVVVVGYLAVVYASAAAFALVRESYFNTAFARFVDRSLLFKAVLTKGYCARLVEVPVCALELEADKDVVC